MTVGHRGQQAQTSGASARAPGHVGCCRGLVEEHQALRVESGLAPDEGVAGLGHVTTLLLSGVQAFFEGDVVRLEKARDGALANGDAVPLDQRAADLLQRQSLWAISVSTASRWSLRRERRSPPIARALACPSARRRCAHRIAVPRPIPNRLAAPRADGPPGDR